jgi:threonine/homoserine/homoserine lactone efflux protein
MFELSQFSQLSQLPLFLLASLAVLLSPGPNVLYVIARSIHQGRKAGVVSVLGLETGTLLQVAAVALGISAIGMSSALTFDAVKYLGAAYLLYLGICKALERGALAESNAVTLASLRRVFGQGVLVSVLNPKTGLFFLAFLPQFVDPVRGNLALQTALLGLIFITLATTTDGGYALLAASLGQRLRRSKHFAIGQRYFAATMFIALGVSAALAERA